jgi:SAM-dependent methyltransferase
VENLPLPGDSADAILAYESFHHIPNRQRAMAGYDRVLREGGRIVLAEPGAAHEHAEVSVDVMHKYGILERGMELDDVYGYAAGTRLTRIEQIFLAKISAADAAATLNHEFLHGRSATGGHLFRLARGDAAPKFAPLGPPRRRVWPDTKRYVKAALRRVGLVR